PSRPPPIPGINGHRSKEQAAVGEGIIPVAVDEDVAGRRPSIVSRSPHPAGSVAKPKSRPPQVAGLIPCPAARDENTLGIRGGRHGLDDRVRRLRQVFNGFLDLDIPISRHKLPTVINLVPVAGNPLTLRGKIAPYAAHPDEVAAIIIPSPIAWNPGDVGAF